MPQQASARPAGWLKSSVLYRRLKTSSVYDAYWRVMDRRIIDERDAEIRFYRTLLDGIGSNGLIFDIGANHGYKADIFLRMGHRVLAVDPDEANQLILRDRFLRLRLAGKSLTIVPKAVSDTAGMQSFWMEEPGSAKNTMSPKWVSTLQSDGQRFGETLNFGIECKVASVTMDDLFAEHGLPFFVKIDVEGHEPSVLAGMSRPVPYLSFEVNLPEFFDEGLRCIRRLQALSASSRFNLAGPKIGDGLLLERWVDADAMADELRRRREPSVEIFCHVADAGRSQ